MGPLKCRAASARRTPSFPIHTPGRRLAINYHLHGAEERLTVSPLFPVALPLPRGQRARVPFTGTVFHPVAGIFINTSPRGVRPMKSGGGGADPWGGLQEYISKGWRSPVAPTTRPPTRSKPEASERRWTKSETESFHGFINARGY